jgi:hypothetical protein
VHDFNVLVSRIKNDAGYSGFLLMGKTARNHERAYESAERSRSIVRTLS